MLYPPRLTSPFYTPVTPLHLTSPWQPTASVALSRFTSSHRESHRLASTGFSSSLFLSSRVNLAYSRAATRCPAISRTNLTTNPKCPTYIPYSCVLFTCTPCATCLTYLTKVSSPKSFHFPFFFNLSRSRNQLEIRSFQRRHYTIEDHFANLRT